MIVREPNVVQALEALALSILDVLDLVADVVRLHGHREAQVKSFQSPANIPNEPYSPTQPKSVGMPQIGAQHLTESDMWGATPYDQLLCRIDFKSMRYDGLYTAPGTDKSLSFPGSLGGMNWGSISTDPVHGFIFVNDMRLGLWVQMIAAPAEAPKAPPTGASAGEALNTGMGAGASLQ